MIFDKFIDWSWNGELFVGEVCDVTLERREQFGNVFVLCVISMKMVEEPSCTLCESILLKYEERQYNLNLNNVLLHFL